MLLADIGVTQVLAQLATNREAAYVLATMILTWDIKGIVRISRTDTEIAHWLCCPIMVSFLATFPTMPFIAPITILPSYFYGSGNNEV
jgi:hypothetical protein